MSENKPMRTNGNVCNELYLATNTDYDAACARLCTPCTNEEWKAMVWWICRHAPEHEKQATQNGWSKEGWTRWHGERSRVVETTTAIDAYPSILTDNYTAKKAKFFWAYLVLPAYQRFRPFLNEYNTGWMNVAEKYDLYIYSMIEMLTVEVRCVARYIQDDISERREEERQQRANNTVANR